MTIIKEFGSGTTPAPEEAIPLSIRSRKSLIPSDSAAHAVEDSTSQDPIAPESIAQAPTSQELAHLDLETSDLGSLIAKINGPEASITESEYTQNLAELSIAEPATDWNSDDNNDRPSAIEELERRGWDDRVRLRAAWYESSAATASSNQRSELYLYASELWSLSGDSEKALHCASLASKGQKPGAFSHRQLRQLTTQVDPAAAKAKLEQEQASAPHPALKIHAALLLAEADRRSAQLSDSSTRRWDAATRANPEDERGAILKFIQQLANPQALPNALPQSSVVRAALADLALLREDPSLTKALSQIAETKSDSAPLKRDAGFYLLKASQARFSKTREPLLESLQALVANEQYGSSAKWLIVGLLLNSKPQDPSNNLSEQLEQCIQSLAETKLGASYALLKTQQALLNHSKVTFDQQIQAELARSHQMALLSLKLKEQHSSSESSSSHPIDGADTKKTLSMSGTLGPLEFLAKNSGELGIIPRTMFATSSSCFSLGGSLASDVKMAPGIREKIAEHLGDEAEFVLCLEESFRTGEAVRFVRTALRPEALDIPWLPDLLWAALCLARRNQLEDEESRCWKSLEQLGYFPEWHLRQTQSEAERRITLLDWALHEAPESLKSHQLAARHEGTSRSVPPSPQGVAASRLLEAVLLGMKQLSNGEENSDTSGLANTESDISRTELAAELQQQLHHLEHEFNSSGLASYLGERAAQLSLDADALLEWVRSPERSLSDKHHNAQADNVELGISWLREALLLSGSDPEIAADCAWRVHRLFPQDIGLGTLLDRLVISEYEQVEWRKQSAEVCSDPELKRVLLLEAAWLLARVNDLSAATTLLLQARAAETKLDSSSNPTTLASTLLHSLADHNHEAANAIIEELAQRIASGNESPESLIYLTRRRDQLRSKWRSERSSGNQWRLLRENLGHVDQSVEFTLFNHYRDEARQLLVSQRAADFEPQNPEPALLALSDSLGNLASCTPPNIAAAFRRIQILQRQFLEHPLRAEDDINALLELIPSDDIALRDKLAIDIYQSRNDSAITALRELEPTLTLDLDKSFVFARIANLLADTPRAQETREAFKQSLLFNDENLCAWIQYATWSSRSGDYSEAALAYRHAANLSLVPANRCRWFELAGMLYLQELNDEASGIACLRESVQSGPASTETMKRLLEYYRESDLLDEIVDLLEARFEATPIESAEALELGSQFAAALVRSGKLSQAITILNQLLVQHPNAEELWRQYANLCDLNKDHVAGEEAYRTLLKITRDEQYRGDYLQRLAEIYRIEFDAPDLALESYRELLKLRPGHRPTQQACCELLLKLGDIAEARELMEALIEAATNDFEKIHSTIALSKALLSEAKQAHEAEQLLIKARKQWPNSLDLLTSLAELYEKTGDRPARQMLLMRAEKEARRAFATDAVSDVGIDIIRECARLLGERDTEKLASAWLECFEGRSAHYPGVGEKASRTELDELLVPASLSTSLRKYLQLLSPIIEVAFHSSQVQIDSSPIDPNQTQTIFALGLAWGNSDTEFYTSTELGSVCLTLGSHPPKLLCGEALLKRRSPDIRDLALRRGLKLCMAGLGRWQGFDKRSFETVLWACLSLSIPGWLPPTGITPEFEAAQETLAHHLREGRPSGLDQLALEVLASLPHRPSTLLAAFDSWAWRTALLAGNDLRAAAQAIYLHERGSEELPSGIAWHDFLCESPTIRDLLNFSLSSQWAEARRLLKL